MEFELKAENNIVCIKLYVCVCESTVLDFGLLCFHVTV